MNTGLGCLEKWWSSMGNIEDLAWQDIGGPASYRRLDQMIFTDAFQYRLPVMLMWKTEWGSSSSPIFFFFVQPSSNSKKKKKVNPTEMYTDYKSMSFSSQLKMDFDEGQRGK